VLIHHIEPVPERQVHAGGDLYVEATLQGLSRETERAEAVSSWLQKDHQHGPCCF
jgi:hypothetical protein